MIIQVALSMRLPIKPTEDVKNGKRNGYESLGVPERLSRWAGHFLSGRNDGTCHFRLLLQFVAIA